jgi:hypothetical protein
MHGSVQAHIVAKRKEIISSSPYITSPKHHHQMIFLQDLLEFRPSEKIIVIENQEFDVFLRQWNIKIGWT